MNFTFLYEERGPHYWFNFWRQDHIVGGGTFMRLGTLLLV